VCLKLSNWILSLFDLFFHPSCIFSFYGYGLRSILRNAAGFLYRMAVKRNCALYFGQTWWDESRVVRKILTYKESTTNWVHEECRFWDVAPCRSCVNRRYGGKYRLHLQGRKICERGTSVSRWLQTESRTDASEERIASIFRVEKSASEEPAWAGGCSLQSLCLFRCSVAIQLD
jgi:hypothetical protein